MIITDTVARDVLTGSIGLSGTGGGKDASISYRRSGIDPQLRVILTIVPTHASILRLVKLNKLDAHPEGWRDRPYEAPATSQCPLAGQVPIPAGRAAWKMRDALSVRSLGELSYYWGLIYADH